MKQVLLILTAFTLSACHFSGEEKYQKVAIIDVLGSETVQEHEGKVMMETYCYACHDATTARADRVAPPMIAIKKHYITKETTKEEFTAAMLTWMQEPTEEKALMFGAVRRFGVMPYQYIPEEDLLKITDYLFEQEIDAPDWFEDHFRKGHGKQGGMKRGKQ